jgi:hypothetical protein
MARLGRSFPVSPIISPPIVATGGTTNGTASVTGAGSTSAATTQAGR